MAIFAGMMLQRRAAANQIRTQDSRWLGRGWCCGSKGKGRWAGIDGWFLRAWEDVVVG